jgi:hypothetical protein
MALTKQQISIPFAEGLDTKTDSKRTPQGRLTTADNVVFDKAGALSRRMGHRALSRTIEGGSGFDTINACTAIASFRDELLCFTGSRVYSYADATERWVDRGEAVCVGVSERTVIRNTYEQKNPDSAMLGNLIVTAWEDSRGGVRDSVEDRVTGTLIVNDASVSATGTRPRVVTHQNSTAIFYAEGVNLRFRRINPVQPTVLATSVNPITTLHATENHFDVKVIGTRLFIAWCNTAADIALLYLTESWANGGVTVTQTPTGGTPLCIDVFGDPSLNVWVAHGNAVSSEVTSWNYSLSALAFHTTRTAPSVRITGAWVPQYDSAEVYCETAGAVASQARLRIFTVSSSGTPSGPFAVARGIGLASRMIDRSDGLTYVVGVHDSPEQATYFLIADSGTIAAKLAYGEGGGLRTTSTVASVFEVDDVHHVATLRKGTLITEAGVTFTRLGVTETSFDFDSPSRFRAVESGGSLVIATGVVQAYDGASVREHGFHLYPEWVTDPAVVVGGGSLGAGSYQFCLMYERTDRSGRVIRSAPSVPKTVVVAANDRVTITFPTLRIPQSSSDVRLVIYRTLVNGTTFFRVTPITSPTLNNTGAESVSYTDGASDASISPGEFIYTTGDILPNISPDACTAITSRGGRVYLGGFADAHALQFSKGVIEGEPVQFADEFRQQVDHIGGAITALCAMDDKTLVFKRGAVFYHAGNGPNEAGEQSDFGDAVLITNDVGCVDPASLLLTPSGVMFKSAKGFYMVDRGLQVSYIGAPVEAWNSYAVSGAALVPDTNRAIFTTRDGPALVFDYLFAQWSTFTNHQSVGCTVWRNQFVMARSDGTVFVSDATKHADGDTAYRLRVVRAWWSFAGLNGFKRLYEFAVLGEYKGGHKLRVQVGYDFNDNFAEESLIDVETELGSSVFGGSSPFGSESPFGGEWPLYQFRVQQTQQLCTSFRIALEEVQTEDFNAALSLSEITCVVGIEQGLNRLRASRIVGTNT